MWRNCEMLHRTTSSICLAQAKLLTLHTDDTIPKVVEAKANASGKLVEKSSGSVGIKPTISSNVWAKFMNISQGLIETNRSWPSTAQILSNLPGV